MEWFNEKGNMRKGFILLVGCQILCAGLAFAYTEDHPPYSFKEGTPAKFELKSLLKKKNDGYEYLSKDKQLVVKLKESSEEPSFLIQDGRVRLMKLEGPVDMKEEGWESETFPSSVYQADLDKNGMEDLIVLSSQYRPSGLGGHFGAVDIFLKKAPDSYKHIHYEGFDVGSEDFIDLNHDGKTELIMESFYEGSKHNYFAYSVYEIKNGRLVNANSKYKGFPKFIWYTEKDNDAQTTNLTHEEQSKHIQESESKIKYEKLSA